MVAVNKEDTKPVDFINLAGFGSKNKDHYNIGDTYYTISDGEGLNNASFNKKTSESEAEILNFEDGKIIKIDDVFFSVINAEGKPCLKPKYGLEEIKYTEGVGHTNTNGAVTEVNNDAVKGGVIPIVANTPYYIFGCGGSSFILAFLKKQNLVLIVCFAVLPSAILIFALCFFIFRKKINSIYGEKNEK